MDSNINDMTSEEIVAEVFKSQFKFCWNSTNNFIKFYETKKKQLFMELEQHIENEPCKFFKKAHKKWQDELDTLNKDLDKTFDNLMTEYRDLEDLISLTGN